MQTFRYWLSVVLGLALFSALLAVTGFGPGMTIAAAQVKEQAYEATFTCAISTGSPECSASADKEIPAGMRLRIDHIKARIVIPSATRAAFEVFVDLGDPGTTGGVRSIRMTPTLVGPTEGRFYNIWALDEKVEGFAYRTEKNPAPRVRLSNPKGDPLYLQSGAIQEGTLGGALVGLQ